MNEAVGHRCVILLVVLLVILLVEPHREEPVWEQQGDTLSYRLEEMRWETGQGEGTGRFSLSSYEGRDETDGQGHLGSMNPKLARFLFQPIDVNQADIGLLSSLSGVGPVLAGRIIEAREKMGGFVALEDLLSVSGVGPRKMADLRSDLAVFPGK
ncbi:MAG: helix-hairpin-helix domain-containing protein [Proteobacteria bacterium]|nr:helix-hairpin-helix domain-containing protein [Pseudomonadota bacterium]MBU1688646.1 helix-hairpin-helix domain-containing protein [Pseudomonadota bacterium]